MVPAVDVAALLAHAQKTRPELKQAQAQQQVRVHASRAAEREATWPSFAAGALYFPPSSAMPHHGYGVSLSVSMPWLWGAAGHRKDAEVELLGAANMNVDAVRIPINAEVVTAEATTRTSAVRLQVLRDRALPASRRSFDVARAGFESGRIDLTAVLDARRAVYEVEREAITARADLERALTDLDAAVGAEVPLRPLGAFEAHRLEGGTDEP
jgi:outer membrane protein TolC